MTDSSEQFNDYIFFEHIKVMATMFIQCSSLVCVCGEFLFQPCMMSYYTTLPCHGFRVRPAEQHRWSTAVCSLSCPPQELHAHTRWVCRLKTYLLSPRPAPPPWGPCTRAAVPTASCNKKSQPRSPLTSLGTHDLRSSARIALSVH